MIIGIDIRMLSRGARTGIEEYTINLLSNMLNLNSDITFKLFYNGHKKVNLEYDFLNLSNVKLFQFKVPNRIFDFSSQFLSCPKIDKLLGGVDVFFSPHIFSSAVSSRCRKAVTFHDLSFEKYSEFYSTGKNYWHFSMNPQKQAQQADKIIAVSKSTKDDLIKIYRINSDKIKVIYSGINQELKIKNQKLDILKIKKKYNLSEKYILYLGTLEPRKNIIGLIKAFENLKKSFQAQTLDLKLVIAGSKGWLYNDIFQEAKNSSIKNDIIFTGFIENNDKHILYNLAEIFVYPSFYEGFGFPPLEAMACGTPVVTSNFSSLPEAVGNAAIMIDPYNLDELSMAMGNLLFDDKLKNYLTEKGFQQIKKFSWQKCARETLDVLKSI